MHIMVCVSGYSGVGKDEFCKQLINKHGAIQTGLADAMKRHLADVYSFTEEQLFGPSKFRNYGDVRYPKPCFHTHLNHVTENIYTTYNGDLVMEGDPKYWLSPREALQSYGELMNTLYSDTWIRKGVEDQLKIATGRYSYTKMGGLIEKEKIEKQDNVITCFADFRHSHEISYVNEIKSKNICTVVLVRIKSKRIPLPPYQHRSEVEQLMIKDSEFDFIVDNDGSVSDLHNEADKIINKYIGNDNV